MKKYFYIVATLVLGLGFTACEDVPAPYELPTDNTPAGQAGVLIDETFASSLGSFTNHTTDGAGGWKIDFGTAKASGYTGSATIAGTYYLVSSEADLTGVDAAHITFDYILAYNKGDENQQLLITDNYDAANPSANWTVISQTWKPENKTEAGKVDWKTFHHADLNVPAQFLGKKVRIAFKYSTNATSGSTWEVKNFKLQKGAAAETPGTDTPGTDIPAPSGTNLLTNGGFETWAGGSAEGWSGPGNTATLSQNTTVFHSGASAINVAGNADSNKRLASKAITLKPGAYTLHFYARGSVAGTSVRPGYVPVGADGAAVNTKYTYGDYANNLPTDSWKAISHNFTLTEQTTVALIFMNPKSTAAGTLIIDDVTLTTTHGGIVEGGTTPDTPTPPATDAIYTKTLLDNAEGWSFDNVVAAAAVPNVWKQSTKYGLVATAYVAADKSRHATEAIAVSPAIQLTANNVLTFEHAGNYFGTAKIQDHCTLLIRETGGAWQPLAIPTYPTNFTYVSSGEISLAAYAGKKIELGFKYTSTGTENGTGTWEFKNIVVK